MNENVVKSLENALREIHKENSTLLEKNEYLQIQKNTSTMSKIAEVLNDNQTTNFGLNSAR